MQVFGSCVLVFGVLFSLFNISSDFPCVLHDLLYSEVSVQWAVCNVLLLVCSMQCVMFSVQFAVCSVQCVVYRV